QLGQCQQVGSTCALSPPSAANCLEVLHAATEGPRTPQVVSTKYQGQNLLWGHRGQSIGGWLDFIKFINGRREVIVHVLSPDVAATAEGGRQHKIQHLCRPASLDIAQGKLPFGLSGGPGWRAGAALGKSVVR